MIAMFLLGVLAGCLLGAYQARRLHRDVVRVLNTTHAAEVRELKRAKGGADS